MHNLEFLLLVLSKRIRHETGKDDLADAAEHLASASHDYEPSRDPEPLAEMCENWHSRFDKHLTGEQKITSRGIVTSAQESIVAAGKNAAEGAIVLAGGVASGAAAAAATAATTASAAARVVFEKVATALEASIPGPGAFTMVHETVVAGVRGAAVGAKKLAGEAVTLEKARLVLDKVATAIEASGKSNSPAITSVVVAALKGAAVGVKALARETATLTAAGVVLDKVATTIEPRDPRSPQKGPA